MIYFYSSKSEKNITKIIKNIKKLKNLPCKLRYSKIKYKNLNIL